MSEQAPMFSPEEIPQTDEPKEKPRVNCLQDMLLELMDERGVSPAMIHKATGIPFPTLQDWFCGKVKSQLLDKNILKLAQYFNVSITYLAFGIGDDDPAFRDFKNEEENENE